MRLKRRASRMGIGYQTLIRILLSEALSSEATAEVATLHEPGDLRPVRWRDYGADRSLFWSSPEELPLWMVICTVLKAGRSRPLFALLEKHGVEKVRYYLEMLHKNGEIKPEIYEYMRDWIELWEKQCV
ncbi:hypothetical protein K3767_11255 (plasmid) [Thermosulfurimonas sp. F29]|nr:hypothetical protein [Thermosulfurimonas sp. F29]